MKLPVLALTLFLSLIAARAATQSSGEDFAALMQQGAKLVDNGSYAKALTLYGDIKAPDTLTPDQQDELTYRIADATWRNLASTNQTDPELVQAQRDKLEDLARQLKKTASTVRPPELWADIQASLGDSYWLNRNLRNPQQAWPYYQRALDWWAGSTDLDAARSQYLALIFRASDYDQSSLGHRSVHFYRGSPYLMAPARYYDNALQLAQDDAQKAELYLLYGRALMNRNNRYSSYQIMQAGEQYQAALDLGQATPSYGDALFTLAQWQNQYGSSHYNENGQWIMAGDATTALKLYRQYVKSFQEGEAPYWSQAKHQIEQLTEQNLQVMVSYDFIPDLPVDFQVVWRNLDAVKVEVFEIEPSEITFPGSEPMDTSVDWWERVKLDGREPVYTWTQSQSSKPYESQSQSVRIEKGLPEGLYVLRASADGETARAWLTVTQAAIVTKSDGEHMHAWAVNAETGTPLADADVQTWLYDTDHRNKTRNWQSASGQTDKDGLATLSFQLPENAARNWLLIAKTSAGPVTISRGWLSNPQYNYDNWRIYAFTDRPAYRPEDTVHWKFSARIREQLAAYSVPAGEKIKWVINDPRGSKVAEATATLNDYGSAWGELPLTADMALGMYNITFYNGQDSIGSEMLFRLEEYKLPEYKVTVTPGSADGEPQTAFQPGAPISVNVQADYYFGGAVSEAEVEVVVHRKPFNAYWQPIQPFPWLASGSMIRPNYGSGTEVQRQKLTTDESGRATFTLDTSDSNNQDSTYTVEARVTDSSRREIIGQAEVHVTRQPYFVYLHPQSQLYRPGQEARITIKSLDANNQPVSASGRVILSRERWHEVWIGPAGEELTGPEYRQRMSQLTMNERIQQSPLWTLQSNGYKSEELQSSAIATDDEGSAQWSFNISKTGYYRVSWFSQAKDGYPIKAQTMLWVADENTAEIEYQGSLKIVADADAFRSGSPAPVMLSTPASGGAVWLTVESDGLLVSRVVRMDGNAKLINLDVTDAWVPNVALTASSSHDYQLQQDRLEVNVPPVKQFLDVTVTANNDTFEPRQNGTLSIETRDHEGKPVAAEVAVSLFDEAVLYIQPDIAPDPREFFYGQMRGIMVSTTSSLNDRQFWTPYLEDLRRQQQQRNRSSLSVEGSFGDESQYADRGAYDAFAPPQMAKAASMSLADAAPMINELAAGAGAAPEPTVVVRSNFSATAYWNPAVMTDANGQASVEVTFPDSLTTWQAEARALSLPGMVGQGSAQMKTRLPLIARLQIPRFLVTGDTVTLSGVINNNTDSEQRVRVSLAQDGDALTLDGSEQTLTVPANGEARADFSVKAVSPGTPKLTLTARGTSHADAMELPLPVYEHGIKKFLAQSGKMLTDSLSVDLDMPEFRPDDATFTITATPSLAATMLDALPYLAKYPYGCVEQTMSRFLPAVIVTRTLKQTGLSEADVLNRAFGGIEDRDVADKQDFTDLPQMVNKGLTRLYDFQHADGGWGWWKGGTSDPFMSAYVVWGLTLCKQADVDIRSDALKRGQDFLQKRLVEVQDQPDLAAWLLHALSVRFEGQKKPNPSKFETQAFERLWDERTTQNAYTRALLTLAAVNYDFSDQAASLADNLANGVTLNRTPQNSILAAGNPTNSAELVTAHWGSEAAPRGWYRWSDGPVEATAFVVKALLAANVNRELADQGVNWLIQNRRGAQWSNTRDTAITILALDDFLKVSGELDAALDYTLAVNGETVATESIPAGHGALAPSVFTVDSSKLKPGKNTITFERTDGEAPLYFSARANFFTLEDPITPAGNVVFVKRGFYRLHPVPTLLDGYREDKMQIESGASVDSGDRVEVALIVQATNDLEYLVFEDLKAAGFEATELQSGTSVYARELRVLPDENGKLTLPAEDAKNRYTGRQRWVYQELRDRKIASFVDKLPEGYWEIRYTLRAETPGKFSALPALGEAMYVPEVRANSAEFDVTVEEKKD